MVNTTIVKNGRSPGRGTVSRGADVARREIQRLARLQTSRSATRAASAPT
jgi:hypothetical protein